MTLDEIHCIFLNGGGSLIHGAGGSTRTTLAVISAVVVWEDWFVGGKVVGKALWVSVGQQGLRLGGAEGGSPGKGSRNQAVPGRSCWD